MVLKVGKPKLELPRLNFTFKLKKKFRKLWSGKAIRVLIFTHLDALCLPLSTNLCYLEKASQECSRILPDSVYILLQIWSGEKPKTESYSQYTASEVYS